MNDDILELFIDFLLAFIPIVIVFIDIENPFWRGILMGFVAAFYPSAFIIKYLKRRYSKKRKPI